MSLLIGFLTFIMVVNCLVLILLVLIQLPKKEAGAGLAFGAGTTDALFGAGSGNALTKLTRYAAGLFMVLCLGLSVLQMRAHQSGSRRLEQQLEKKALATPAPANPGLTVTAAASNAITTALSTNKAVTVPPVEKAPAPAPAAPAK